MLGGLGLKSRRQDLLKSLSKYVCLEGKSQPEFPGR